MIVQGVSISDMLNQSMQVLTKPSIQTLEQYERRGGQREALTYIGVAAAIAGVAGLLGGFFSGGILGALLYGVLGALGVVVGFLIFVNVVHFVGKSQGGTGELSEVYYTLALISAPILAINNAVGAIPVLGCIALPVTFALGIYQIYLSYLGTRSSMNIEQTPAIITVIAGYAAQIIVGMIIGGIFAAIAVALGVVQAQF
jgi:hypothetical protein